MTVASGAEPGRPARREHRLAIVVVFLVLVVIAPFLATGAVMVARYVEEGREDYEAQVRWRVEVIARAVDRRIRAAVRTAGALASSADLVEGDLDGFARQLDSFAGASGAPVIVYDPAGAVLLSSRDVPAGATAAEPAILAEVTEGASPGVGHLVTHPGSDRPEVFVYVPVSPAGGTDAVLALAVPADEILEIVQESLREEGWFASVVDGEGRIVARSYRHDDFFGRSSSPAFFAGLVGDNGILESVDLEGREVLTGYERSRASDWVVLTWVPLSTLSAPADRAIWLLLLVPGVTILGSVVLALGASRMILRPLRRLHRMAGEIAEGRAVRFEPTALLEANVVGAALARASSQLSQSLAELKSRSRELESVNDKLNLALDSAQAGAWELDLTTFRGSWSRENFALFGAEPAAEPPDFKVFLDRHVHPDDRERLEKAIRSRIERGETEIVEDYRILHPVHGLRWISARGKVERDGDGRPLRLTGLNQDITGRKETEEHIQLLLREVNHRSKNMLAVVQAIARATAKAEPEEFLARFSDRVQSLSASQDLLVQSNWRGADMADLARAQLAHFQDSLGVRITLEGPPVLLRPGAAQAIGMALHELGTNAGKYGALSDDGAGRIAVSWGPVADGDRFRVAWTETGGPPPRPPGARGFGSTVIEVMSRRSLDADVHYEIGPDGVRWSLECAASAAIEPHVASP